ncbi:PKD domain-containing protein [Ekhidna sp.]|uniref:PKD domain-containing protein n=1 Tax=Ekhidna sp. TaxID=2608089 RepID=UPI00355A8D31
MFAQTDLNNWGTTINIQPGAEMYVSGDFVLNEVVDVNLATIRNTGTLRIGGDLVNNSTTEMFLDEGRPGPIIFVGDGDQLISGNDSYIPSIFLDKISGDLYLNQNLKVDSTIFFAGSTSGNLYFGDYIILMEANGIIQGETSTSKLVLENGFIRATSPTLNGIQSASDSVMGFSIRNLYGLGFGISSNDENIQGEPGGEPLKIFRYERFDSPTQVANGNTASRFYRLEFYEPDLPDEDPLDELIFNYFQDEITPILPTSTLALYVSNDNGNSWLKLNGDFISGSNSDTLIVKNVNLRGLKGGVDNINWFTIAQADCDPEHMPNTLEAITATTAIDKSEEIFEINICEGDDLIVEYRNDNEYLWEFGVDTLDDFDKVGIIPDDEGIYKIRLRNNKGCETFRDIQVNVWGPPPADFDYTAGNICDSETVTFTDMTPDTEGEIVRYLWDFGDGGNFSELESPSHVYEVAGNYTVTLEVESEYGCIGTTQETVTIRPRSIPLFDVKTSKSGSVISTRCSGESFFFDPSSSVFFTNLAGNQEIPSISWDFGDGTIVNLTPDGSSIVETFGEISHEYIVSDDTDFIVTLTTTTRFGCSDSYSQMISVYAEPDPTFVIKEGGLATIESCTNSSLLFESNQALADESSYDYLWSFGDGTGTISTNPNPIFSYISAGTYTVELTVTSKTTGCTVSSTQAIDISNAPTTPYGDIVSSCGSNITLDAENPGSTYRWLDGYSLTELSTNQTYEVTSASEDVIPIILEITNGSGCVISQEIQVYLNTDLNVDLGADFTACESAVIGTNEFPLASFVWSTGETTPFIEVTESRTYSVEISEGGCTSTDEITITIANNPVVDLGSDREICEGELLTLNAGSHTSYLWSDGTGSSNIVVSSSGIYWVEVENVSGCLARDSISVVVKDDEVSDPGGGVTPCDLGCAGSVDASFRMEHGLSSNELCRSSEVQFISQAGEGDPTAYDFYWDFDDGTNSTEPFPYKQYSSGGVFNVSLSVTSKIDGCNAVFSDNFQVQLSPQIPINDVVTTCGGELLLDAQNTGSTFRWIDEVSGATLSTNQEYKVISSSEDPIYLILEITNSFGCIGQKQIQVNLNADLNIDLGEDFLACGSVFIGSNEFPTASFLWSTGETSPTIEVSETGLYGVTVTDSENSCSSEDEVFITVESMPNPNLGENFTLCFGEEVELTPGEFSQYLWSTGATTSSIMIGSSGTYWVEVANESGCTDRDTLEVSLTNDRELNLPAQLELCSSTGIEIDAGISANRYLWGSSNGFTSSERVVMIDEAGTYWLEVEGECIQRDTVQVVETTDLLEPSFLIPSVVGVGDLVNIIQLTDPLPDSQSWSFGDGVFSTQVNPIHQYASTGDYEITLTITNGGCSYSVSKTITVVESRFEEELVKNQLIEILKLRTYPNPIEDEVNIELELSKDAPILVRIFSLSGHEVFRQKYDEATLNIPINMSDQIAGLYLLSVQVGGNHRLIKIIKPK